MRKGFAKLAMVAVLGGVVLAPLTIAFAQQASPDVRVDLTLKDADLLAATNILFQRTGIQFVIEPSDVPYGRIASLKIEGVTPEEAVRYICQAAGAYFRRDENGVYIISHNKPVIEAPVKTEPTKKAWRPLTKIPILRADARSVYEAIRYELPMESSRGFDELRAFSNKMMPNIVGSNQPPINILNTQLPSQTFTPISAPAQSAPLTGVESGSQVALPGEAANQRGGGAGFGGGGQGNGGFGGQGGQGGIGGNQGGGQNGATQLTGGQGLVDDGIDFISFDPTDNSLVVRGDDDAINHLQEYIALFDVAPKQVQIKVEFITTTEGFEKSLGYEFLYQRGSMITGTNPGVFVRAQDPVFLSYATGNITGRLRASLTETGGKVVQAPILRTLNNQPATIQSQIQTYIFINTTTVSNGTVLTTSNPFPLLASTILSVTPRINEGDNTITMFLNPQIQSFVGTSRGPQGQEFPNQVSQVIGVTARVKNNETIVLGGLNQKNEDASVLKVPILADLPIIGQFFRSTRKARNNSELLIFVTPSIVEDDQTAGLGV